jgi:hypothetical protein
VSLTVGCHKKGMAFGTGSAVAHRAVDAVAGPRQIEHGKKRKESLFHSFAVDIHGIGMVGVNSSQWW